MSLPDFYMAWLMATSEVQRVKENPFVPDLMQSLKKRLDALRHSRAFKMALFLDPRFNYHGSKLFTGDEKEEIQVKSIVGKISNKHTHICTTEMRLCT